MQNKIKGQKFLVTGCAGFIGSFVTEALLEKGAYIYGIDNLNTGSLNNIKHLLKNKNFKFIKADFCDKKVLEKLVRKVDYIYHAAVRGIGLSVENPILELKVNTEGTLRLLELMRKSKVKRLVYASSASVYGNATEIPEKEAGPTFPLSPYGVSKLAAERYVITYHNLYNLPVVALRYFNVYGPRQRNDSLYGGVVSIFINQAIHNKPLTIYGNGTQTRDFTYIADVVKATVDAFFTDNTIGKVLNISAGHEYTIKKLAQMIQKVSGKKDLKIELTEKRLIDNIERRFGDISLARKILKYNPSTKLENGLDITYQWWLKQV